MKTTFKKTISVLLSLIMAFSVFRLRKMRKKWK